MKINKFFNVAISALCLGTAITGAQVMAMEHNQLDGMIKSPLSQEKKREYLKTFLERIRQIDYEWETNELIREFENKLTVFNDPFLAERYAILRVVKGLDCLSAERILAKEGMPIRVAIKGQLSQEKKKEYLQTFLERIGEIDDKEKVGRLSKEFTDELALSNDPNLAERYAILRVIDELDCVWTEKILRKEEMLRRSLAAVESEENICKKAKIIALYGGGNVEETERYLEFYKRKLRSNGSSVISQECVRLLKNGLSEAEIDKMEQIIKNKVERERYNINRASEYARLIVEYGMEKSLAERQSEIFFDLFGRGESYNYAREYARLSIEYGLNGKESSEELLGRIKRQAYIYIEEYDKRGKSDVFSHEYAKLIVQKGLDEFRARELAEKFENEYIRQKYEREQDEEYYREGQFREERNECTDARYGFVNEEVEKEKAMRSRVDNFRDTMKQYFPILKESRNSGKLNELTDAYISALAEGKSEIYAVQYAIVHKKQLKDIEVARESARIFEKEIVLGGKNKWYAVAYSTLKSNADKDELVAKCLKEGKDGEEKIRKMSEIFMHMRQDEHKPFLYAKEYAYAVALENCDNTEADIRAEILKERCIIQTGQSEEQVRAYARAYAKAIMAEKGDVQAHREGEFATSKVAPREKNGNKRPHPQTPEKCGRDSENNNKRARIS